MHTYKGRYSQGIADILKDVVNLDFGVNGSSSPAVAKLTKG